MARTSESKISSFIIFNFFFFCIVLATISAAKTSSFIIPIIDEIRRIVVALVIIFGVLNSIRIIKKGKISKVLIGVIIFSSMFFIYGVLLSTIFGGIKFFIADPMLVVFLVVAINFCISVGSIDRIENLDEFLQNRIILYTLFILTLLVFSRGLILEIPPRFIFQYEGPRAYSQGITKFFIIATLATLTWMIQNNNSFFKSIIGLMLTVCFIFLAVIGAARGDFLLGFILIIILFLKVPRYLIILLSFAILFLMFYEFNFHDLKENILIVRRLSVLSEANFGMREVFSLQVLNLLMDNPICLILGGGFNYFQVYYNYNYGSYPHNFIFELIITFGLPLTIFMLIFSIIGIFRIFKLTGGSSLFLLLGIYFLLVNLKSGSLINFLSIGYLAYFTVIGWLSIFKFKTVFSSDNL